MSTHSLATPYTNTQDPLPSMDKMFDVKRLNTKWGLKTGKFR